MVERGNRLIILLSSSVVICSSVLESVGVFVLERSRARSCSTPAWTPYRIAGRWTAGTFARNLLYLKRNSCSTS